MAAQVHNHEVYNLFADEFPRFHAESANAMAAADPAHWGLDSFQTRYMASTGMTPPSVLPSSAHDEPSCAGGSWYDSGRSQYAPRKPQPVYAPTVNNTVATSVDIANGYESFQASYSADATWSYGSPEDSKCRDQEWEWRRDLGSHEIDAPTVPQTQPPMASEPRVHHVADMSDERVAGTAALIIHGLCNANPACPVFPPVTDAAALFFSPYKQSTFTLDSYCQRLLVYTGCSKSCFVVALLYMARMAENRSVYELNYYNVHRLLCTALVLASKYLDDASYSNAHYAKVSGIQTVAEMNKLEAHMLEVLDYRLHVTQENYDEVEIQIASIANTHFGM